jgi:hypothetical protein
VTYKPPRRFWLGCQYRMDYGPGGASGRCASDDACRLARHLEMSALDFMTRGPSQLFLKLRVSNQSWHAPSWVFQRLSSSVRHGLKGSQLARERVYRGFHMGGKGFLGVDLYRPEWKLGFPFSPYIAVGGPVRARWLIVFELGDGGSWICLEPSFCPTVVSGGFFNALNRAIVELDARKLLINMTSGIREARTDGTGDILVRGAIHVLTQGGKNDITLGLGALVRGMPVGKPEFGAPPSAGAT